MTELLNPGTNCDCHNNKKLAGKLNELLVKRTDVCMCIHTHMLMWWWCEVCCHRSDGGNKPSDQPFNKNMRDGWVSPLCTSSVEV